MRLDPIFGDDMDVYVAIMVIFCDGVFMYALCVEMKDDLYL